MAKASLGKHAEAERLLRNSINITLKVMGEANNFTLSQICLLAKCLQNQRKFDDCLFHVRHAIEIPLIVEDYTEALGLLSDLEICASQLYDEGELVVAKEIATQVVAGRLKLLGPSDVSTSKSQE